MTVKSDTRYYHASHVRKLPKGTLLKGERGVFMSQDLIDAHDWAHLLGNHYVYQVQPRGNVEKRYQKDALGEYEWVADEAEVVAFVAEVTANFEEYCDGCFVY